ncbi:MAG: 3-phosphoglycerate dehydrogenase [Chloroflexi bacterium]|nr:3-phosphoglycerate dehydrogenase [Chloroflexota bacterium]MYF64767.1 3-phosphoglycerate dehydrogenase [Chloroflexota bacterium]MYK34958.1 3-phosphoglycerate dehydrogenase [Chloroflexota bacterium]
MNSLVLAPFSDEGIIRLVALGRVVHEPWTETRTLWDPEELGARLTNEGFDALVVEADFLFEELFDTARGLRIAAICRGDLHHADLDAATERGIAVVRTPARNAQAVAEFAVAQMLALARHTSIGERYVREGQWEDPTEPYVRFRGRELAGATLGIVGFGAIGRAVARIAAGFGMRVLAYDPYVSDAEGVEMTSLEALLAASDFVSMHVSDTPETMGMLNESRIAAMKPGAYLVNVTNSSVADRAALAAALASGGLAGAALDVHEAHPIPPDSPFLGLPNVLLTPHIGGATQETIERHSAMVAEDFERFARGEQPLRLVNPDVWGRLRG